MHRPDASTIPIDAGPPVRLVIETFDSTPCPDWEIATHPAPALPLDAPASPVVLWEWSPVDDPMLAGLSPGISGYEMLNMTVSATGDVWVRAPTETDLTRVTRDGAAGFHVRIDDPSAHRVALGRIAAAPDGTVFVTTGGTSSFVAQYSPAGLVARTDMVAGMDPRPMMVGAGGHTMIQSDEYCRVRRTRSLRISQRGPSGAYTTGGWGAGWIEANGALVGNAMNLASRPAFEVDGTLSWRFGVDPSIVTPGFAIEQSGTSAGHDLITTGVLTGTDFTQRLLSGEDTLYEEDYPDASRVPATLMLDGTGALWRFDSESGMMRRIGHWPDRPAPCLRVPGYNNFVFADDGTVVCVSLTTFRMMALSPDDGSVLWELAADPADPAAGFYSIVGPDLDGRIYAAMQRPSDPFGAPHLVAIQTNLRPPGDGFCHVEALCNRHRNGWAHDYRPAP